jgi:hypothetical protein
MELVSFVETVDRIYKYITTKKAYVKRSIIGCQLRGQVTMMEELN